MLVGFNYPYSNNLAGAQIGPYPWVPASQWIAEQAFALMGQFDKIQAPKLFEKLDSNLQHLAKMKISVVRFFLLANGFNYGLPPTGGNSDWQFSPPTKVDPRFANDFKKLLQSFASAGLKIIPSLISFEFGGNRQGDPPVNQCAAGGKYDCMTDKTKQKTFLGTLLTDLLLASKGYERVIYCWEVINEPYWDTSFFGSDGNRQKAHLSDEQMNQFLNAAIKVISDAGFASTVGHRFYSDLTVYPTGSVPQFHYYAKTFTIRRPGILSTGPFVAFFDPPYLKGAGLFKREPKPFLGEFDSDFNIYGKPWKRDLSPEDDTTYNRLKLLEAEGCDLAIIWGDRPANKADVPAITTDDQVKLQQRTREQIALFTGGSVDPGTW